jgi:hypothetical protein
MSKWTRGSKRKRRKGNSKPVSGKVVKVGTAEERSETPQVTGKRKIVQVGTAGEKADN